MNQNQSLKLERIPLWRQLRWNLVFFFLILAIIPLVVVEGITLRQVTDKDTQLTITDLQTIANLKRDQISRWIQDAYGIMQAARIVPSSTKSLMGLLTNPTDTDQQNTVNEILKNVSTIQVKQGTTSTENVFDQLIVYDTKGHILAASSDAEIGKIVAAQPYFAASLKGDYVQPPYYEVETGTLSIVTTILLTDEKSQTIGVLAGKINVATLSQIMTNYAGVGETGETYLVSLENNYLLTPSRFPNYPSAHAYHSPSIDSVLKGQDGNGLYTNYEQPGVPVIGVYEWIPELQVGLIAEITQSEALATSGQLVAFDIVLTFLAIVIAGAIGLTRLTQISNPIIELTHITTQIAGGDLTGRADIRQKNEIGVLAGTFNQMTEKLVANITQLDASNIELNKTNDALRVATAQAKEAARIKGEFLANMSHELRTPLNAIIGFSDMLLVGMSGPLTEKQQHKMVRLKDNGVRLLTLINDLLDLTRIESGRLETTQKPFSPRALAERMVAQMESLAIESKLTFDVRIDPTLPATVLGDEKRIEQVVINLLSNGFKFTKEGSVTLEMNTDPTQSTWNVTVTDTGIGIPPHALNLIFEEFRQLDGSYSRAYKGSGLGLAITRNLVRIMGGKISVKSTLGVGSAFTVVFPMIFEEKLVLAEPVRAVN